MKMQYLIFLKHFSVMNVFSLWPLNSSRWLIKAEEWMSLLACVSSMQANLLVYKLTETPYLKENKDPLLSQLISIIISHFTCQSW